jgi:4,5-dihydroxyphthalate decarboxylase
MVVIQRELAESRPDIVRTLYKALVASRLAVESGANAFEPYGFAGVQNALEIGIRYAVAQGLIPKSFTTDELYGSVREALRGLA